jgi:hypothetical protein
VCLLTHPSGWVPPGPHRVTARRPPSRDPIMVEYP